MSALQKNPPIQTSDAANEVREYLLSLPDAVIGFLFMELEAMKALKTNPIV